MPTAFLVITPLIQNYAIEILYLLINLFLMRSVKK